MLCSPTGFDCLRQKWLLSIISQVEDCPISCSGTAILRSDILNSIKMVSRAKLRSVIGDVITGHKIIPLNKSFFSGCSASVKVLNSGLGPFKDQTAEMVLFWSFFLHKSPFFPCNPVPGTKEAAC